MLKRKPSTIRSAGSVSVLKQQVRVGNASADAVAHRSIETTTLGTGTGKGVEWLEQPGP